MLHCETDPEQILDEEDRDVLVVQVPDDEPDNEERKIDNSVVHNFVDKLKPDPT